MHSFSLGGEALWGDLSGAPEDKIFPPEVQQQQDGSAAEGGGGEAEKENCLPSLSNDSASFEAPSKHPMDEAEAAKEHGDGGKEEKECVTQSTLHPIPIKYGQAVGFTGEGASQKQNWTIQNVSGKREATRIRSQMFT